MKTNSRLSRAYSLIIASILSICFNLTAWSEQKNILADIDAPLLFTKRHSYKGIHIYDAFYKWPPGGGGIYIIDNTHQAPSEWKERCLIGEGSKVTLGKGLYTHPELSWDAKRLLFCYKGEPQGNTCIYEINIDGSGLRQITNPESCGISFKGTNKRAGMHDLAPAYLPDGRIVFLSTRAAGLVPCNNSGVTLLHVMNADGSDIHPISVNSENEFDPCVLPDGRIIFGRWEYIDKNALTVQSLWTVHPDGSNETALFGNNMTFPEACIDPRPVPGSHLIATTLSKHNAAPRGTVAYIDPFKGKNNPEAIFNFITPSKPTEDRGNSCEPYPLNERCLLASGRPKGQKRNVIEFLDKNGTRQTLISDPSICLHDPMLVKARPTPRILPTLTDRSKKTGQFFVQNVYEGLKGIKPGEAKWLRVVEESSRVSPSPLSKTPYNQTFLVSGALAFAAKIYHGMVPINDDGSIYFEAPSGRLLYFQVLDKDKRLIRSMRTFIQAAPGVTRSCIGCHEDKSNTPSLAQGRSTTLRGKAAKLQDESWGSGYMDYPSMIQPIWDKHCIDCHGGEKGFAGRLDLTGGWTTHFNNSYENLIDRKHTQLVAHYISGIDSMNGTAHYSNQLFPPRSHGSATAPLAKVVMSEHHGAKLSQKERDLVMAWIDSNGIYYGNWDYTDHGYTSNAINNTYQNLSKAIQAAKCTQCHEKSVTRDWINLSHPELSRILRAPLAKGPQGYGLALCKDTRVDPLRKRITLLRSGRYEHAVKPLSYFPKKKIPKLNEEAPSYVSFKNTDDPSYQQILNIIHTGRLEALKSPRIDMPGAVAIAGEDRMLIEPDVPVSAPPLQAEYQSPQGLRLHWSRTAKNIGLKAEIHRSNKRAFTPNEETLIAETLTNHHIDQHPRNASPYYALVLKDKEGKRSKPSYIDTQQIHPEILVASKGLGAIRIKNGKVTQTYKTPGICQDAWQLLDGSVIASGKSGLRKYKADGSLLFEYLATNKQSEIHTCMPLADNRTLIAESGPARIIELDHTGKPHKTIPVDAIKLKHPHKQMRGVRKTKSGDYHIISTYEKRLLILNSNGSLKKEINLKNHPSPKPTAALHSIVPLPQHRQLIGTSYGSSFVILDENQGVEWELTPEDVPELGMKYAAGAHVLPNGNLICTSYNSDYPIFEITPDKHIVWKIKASSEIGQPLHVQAVKDPGNPANFELLK
ncbi:hypothetical protein HW115_02055 [Verrucomicrobiaceae bacterium N1E253]|uniref:Hydrazine synthase alpha subunit middle domain-containing protein n=1 Tax=Oceaniferula marina TaxID=2748318 RepID=A0A851G9J1_9BACT|nr:hypothetical protein [Oceaniferula marina]NWK54378.1 hypothetical protein [Oceaniferula marina]